MTLNVDREKTCGSQKVRIGLTRLERNAAYDDGEAEHLHRVPGHQHHDFADQPVDAFYGAQKELIRGRVASKIGLGLGQNRQLHEVDAKCRVLLTQTQATGSTTRSHPTARGRATVRLRALASAARRPDLTGPPQNTPICFFSPISWLT